MKYVVYKGKKVIATVGNEQEARKKAIAFDKEDPADIQVKDDNGVTVRFIIVMG